MKPKQENKNDEVFRIFHLEWNISQLLECVRKSKIPAFEVKVADLIGQNTLIRVDPEYAMKTDLEKPLILIEFQENKYLLADGHHRLYKAEKTGVETLQAYFVPLEVHVRYLADIDMVKELKKLYG